MNLDPRIARRRHGTRFARITRSRHRTADRERPPDHSSTDDRSVLPRRRRLRVLDAVDEMLAGILARPLRATLTALGTVLGLASLVATLGISATAGNQIVAHFDELGATQVTVRPARAGNRPSNGDGGNGHAGGARLPWNVEARVDPLNGVVASGAIADVADPGLIRTNAVADPTGRSSFTVPVVAASSGVLHAVRGHIDDGRWFDEGHVTRVDPVVVLGADLAEDLGITDLSRGPGIFVGDHFYVVIGTVDRAERDRGFEGSVIVPSSRAQRDFGVTTPDRVVIDVELGAADLIAAQAPTALSPNAPDSLRATAPASPTESRDAVEGDVNGMFVVLGLISLAVGAIGIANVTLVTVMERTGEIGLRRALGAKRRHIAGQFLGESAALGLVGGIVGASLGIVAVVVVAASRDWTPVLDARLPLAAPLAGALVGLLAGLYPAVRAARMEPVDALRAGL